MLCPRGLQSAFSPFVDSYWPVRSQWPEVKPPLYQQDLLQMSLQELHSSLELMEKLQHKIAALGPVSYQLQKDGEHFGLTLETQGFSPEELSVRQEGRRLRVSGKTEKKQEDEKGCCSYRHQEFTQEFDLPEGLNLEEATCCLHADGKLHIQAAGAPCVEEAERELTMARCLQSVCTHTEGGSTETHNRTQDMDSTLCLGDTPKNIV
ncbi:heat shock protein 30-like [Xiphias gladius]|uniref:heat shock protein 30-like n=1 Tax=Xiphias gladius TaxID=8245 RepID=UPI001A988D16|nr:heat shock protein 30-like [Xiphias gladius]